MLKYFLISSSDLEPVVPSTATQEHCLHSRRQSLYDIYICYFGIYMRIVYSPIFGQYTLWATVVSFVNLQLGRGHVHLDDAVWLVCIF